MLQLIPVVVALLAAGPSVAWISVRNALKQADTLQVFLNEETEPRCELAKDQSCEFSVPAAKTYAITVKRASDGAVCLTVRPHPVTSDEKYTIKDCP